jgi:hypothetical protein
VVLVEKIIERFDAQWITREDQCLFGLVPDRERKHAAQPAETGRAPLRIRPEDDFGVGIRAPVASELAAQFAEVVTLAVVSNAVACFSICHRLMTGGSRVNNCEPGVSENNVVHLDDTIIIRAAVFLRRVHALHSGFHIRSARQINNARYAAHL